MTFQTIRYPMTRGLMVSLMNSAQRFIGNQCLVDVRWSRQGRLVHLEFSFAQKNRFAVIRELNGKYHSFPMHALIGWKDAINIFMLMLWSKEKK